MSEPASHRVHSALVHAGAAGRRPHVGIIAKRQYRLQQGVVASGTPAPLVTKPHHVEIDEEDSLLVRDSDLVCLQKETTDILLDGTGYSHRGAVTELHTALQLGAVRKDVLVTGERTLRVGANGSLSATHPLPFESMKLSWQRAYGGRDRGSESVPPDRPGRAVPSLEDIVAHGSNAYPRNRVGMGFFVDEERQRLDGMALPRQSDPADRIELSRLLAADPYDWLDRPASAGYGPIDWLTFPRCLFFGLKLAHAAPQRPVHEVSLGALRADELSLLTDSGGVQARAFNCAPPGLAATRLTGSERVDLYNLHRQAEHFAFALPNERPRLVLEPPNAGTFELEPKLATVLIEPDEDRVTLTWAGSTPAAGIYSPEMCAEMRHAAIWN